MDIAAWLRGLGLAPYEPAFRENAIDSAVLPNLTAEDLKDLRVLLVGHRRRLLNDDQHSASYRTCAGKERRSPLCSRKQRRQAARSVAELDAVLGTPLAQRGFLGLV